MTNVTRLINKLDDMGMQLGGITLGFNDKYDPELVAAEILKALEELEDKAWKYDNLCT